MSSVLIRWLRAIWTRLGVDEERAVSEVIATVLLVAIVVTITGSVAVTVNGMVNGQVGATEQVLSQLHDAMELACDDAGFTCTFE